VPKFQADGFCDDNNNNAGCAWDGGGAWMRAGVSAVVVWLLL
jgi:hypothetical protein